MRSPETQELDFFMVRCALTCINRRLACFPWRQSGFKSLEFLNYFFLLFHGYASFLQTWNQMFQHCYRKWLKIALFLSFKTYLVVDPSSNRATVSTLLSPNERTTVIFRVTTSDLFRSIQISQIHCDFFVYHIIYVPSSMSVFVLGINFPSVCFT